MNSVETGPDFYKRADGYTLLEIMVALIIMGISVTAVTGGLSGAKRLSARAEHTLEAARILNNLKNNPAFISRVIENDEIEGLMDNEPGWQCSASAEPLVVNTADLQVLESENEAKTWKNEKMETGEEVDVPDMVEIKICVTDREDMIDKAYCLTLWKSRT
ncbi:MAG: type II secretion system protein [Thermodesulfobacteriota bacterium]|nr:type II secretion system protein [Thermodesulfobacteriota bacterium]